MQCNLRHNAYRFQQENILWSKWCIHWLLIEVHRSQMKAYKMWMFGMFWNILRQYTALIDSESAGMSMNCPQNVKNDKNNHLWLYMMIIVWNISSFLYNIERIFTNGSLRLQWLNGTGSWGVCDGPNSHQLVGSDFFVPWLAAKPQEPMTIAWVNRSQQLLQHVYKIP